MAPNHKKWRSCSRAALRLKSDLERAGARPSPPANPGPRSGADSERQVRCAKLPPMKRDWLPIPPIDLLIKTCGAEVEDHMARVFKETAENLLSELHRRDLIREGDRVLEVHCGCGRFARVLLDEPIASYMGFDRQARMLDWARGEISRRDPRFSFLHFDGGGEGTEPDSLRWPLEDASIDLAVVESVLTKMAVDQAQHYLSELARLTAPGGRVVFDLFFAVARTYSDPGAVYYNLDEVRAETSALGFDLEVREPVATGKTPNWCILRRRGH